MKYSLVSDMHLDFPQPKTPPLEEMVIIAGDCGNGLIGLKWINNLKRKGHKVFAVDGNHEHYANASQGRSWKQTTQDFYDGVEHHHIHDVSEDLRIIGQNGWYLVEDEDHWRAYMNDAKCGMLTKEFVNAAAEAQAIFIEFGLKTAKGKVIVVTHTAPCYESLDPRYEGSSGNPYYVNPLMTPLLAKYADKIHVWHHGHTHAAVDVVKDGVRIITNPRGYPGENPSWQPLVLTA